MKKMLIPLIIVVALVITAGVIYLVAVRSPDAAGFDFSRTEQTLQTGTPAKAKVATVRDTGGRLNGNPSIEFELEVQPATGTVFTARTRAIISTVDLPRFQPGAIIDVKYDPADHASVAVIH